MDFKKENQRDEVYDDIWLDKRPALRGQIFKSVPASEMCPRLRNGKVIADSFLTLSTRAYVLQHKTQRYQRYIFIEY